jgi:hypothetical protein
MNITGVRVVLFLQLTEKISKQWLVYKGQLPQVFQYISCIAETIVRHVLKTMEIIQHFFGG